MTKDRAEVLEVVLKALREDQEAVSAKPVELTEDSRPLECLGGFDSLASVAVTQRCLDALGIKAQRTTVFVGEDDNGRPIALTLRKVVDCFMELR